jgi:predicted solute-binding protein
MAVLNVIYSDNRQLTSSPTKSITVNAERRLRQRVGVSLPLGTASRREGMTIDLAQSWLEFYRHCQIFGDIKHQNPRQDIARCGLTAISRRYLQVLLENYLGVNAAEEL